MASLIQTIVKKILFWRQDYPILVPRSKHSISRKHISEAALKVMRRLHQEGMAAYLVGGGVRDLLLGRTPNDYDIATDAHPEQVSRLFRNSRLIGRRFKIVHIYFGPEIIEVATFRAHSAHAHPRSDTGRVLQDNVYGDIEEDAWRRDFTINSLYYNIADFSVVDYTGGLKDLKQKSVRIIGEAEQRYREDAVRMLRCIRLAGQLDFAIEKHTQDPIPKLAHLLQEVPSARLFDEILKLFYSGAGVKVFHLLEQNKLFATLFPDTAELLDSTEYPMCRTLIERGLSNTDLRQQQNLSLNPGFLFAFLLWWPLQARIAKYQSQEMAFYPALHEAIHDVLQRQIRYIAIPRRFTLFVREVWLLQYQLKNRRRKRVFRNLVHPRLRAGIDFLELRALAGENISGLTKWWKQFSHATPETRDHMVEQIEKKQRTKKRNLKSHD